MVYGFCACVYSAQQLVLNPSVTEHCSTLPCKNMLTLLIVRRLNMARVRWLFSLTVSCPAASWMQDSCQSAADPCWDLTLLRQGSH